MRVRIKRRVTADKLKQVNLLESLPYEVPEEEIPEEMEVSGEIDMSDENLSLEDDGQITLTLD